MIHINNSNNNNDNTYAILIFERMIHSYLYLAIVDRQHLIWFTHSELLETVGIISAMPHLKPSGEWMAYDRMYQSQSCPVAWSSIIGPQQNRPSPHQIQCSPIGVCA